MSKKAVICGYSGHAYVIAELLLARGYELAGYFDNQQKDNNPFNLVYLGKEPAKAALATVDDTDVFICIGNNGIRARIFKQLVIEGLNNPAVIHPRAVASQSAVIGSGTVVMAGAVINAFAKIGNAVICNTSCVIEHECLIGDYTHIAPGAVLAGDVTIGSSTFIGANTVVKQGINIGANVTIGAGSVVVKDVPDGVTVYGNPATKAK